MTQMSAGDRLGRGADVRGHQLSPGADVGVGWIRLRCRCGPGWTLSQCKGGQWIDSVQLQMWVGGGLGPGADVGGYGPSPVVIDERSPTMRMRAYRG